MNGTMRAVQFPASAANALIEGYCDDFVAFAAILAQTLEQISMRGIEIDKSKESLQRIEHGMRELADAIHDLQAGNEMSMPLASSGRDQDDDTPLETLPEEKEETQPEELPELVTARTPRPLKEEKQEGPELKGNNQSMPLLSVCQFLGRMRKNGIMHVTIMDEELSFEFANGCVQHTTSTGCPANERTGEILIAMGFCTAKDLEPLLAKAAVSNEPLGNLILHSRVISHGQLLEALERQVQLRFLRACKTTLASYWFEEGTCSPTDGRIHITPFELTWQQKNDG